MTAPGEGSAAQLPAEYILPLRWTDDAGLPDLVDYLQHLVAWIPVTVVDGSGPDLFARHREQFPPEVRHMRPAGWSEPGSGAPQGNGKVAGVATGVREARAELLVIADDDVRYTRGSLAAVVDHLGYADVVRPQNYFDPLPWHALWDTSRSLISRAWSADFPGTLGLRRSAFLATDGYEPVLFENLELIRTVEGAGGSERTVPGLYIARRPPKARHFLKQRLRQAYDDFAQPRRLAAELALLPAVIGAAALPRRTRTAVFAGLAAAAVAAAETGRRRHGGAAVFPLRAVCFAPLWAMERAVGIWAAVAFRLTGGVPYAGARIRRAAHSKAELRRRHHGKLQAFRQQATAPTLKEQP